MFHVTRIKDVSVKFADADDGYWAYVEEIPTMRCWGKDKPSAFARLVMMIDETKKAVEKECTD